MLKFFYRYSQVFNVVFSCQAADVSSVSDFILNPVNHVLIYDCNCLCYIQARSSSKLARRVGTKTLSLTYPHTVQSRGVKSGDCGGSFRSTISNPSNHRAIEVGSNLMNEVQGAPSCLKMKFLSISCCSCSMRYFLSMSRKLIPVTVGVAKKKGPHTVTKLIALKNV